MGGAIHTFNQQRQIFNLEYKPRLSTIILLGKKGNLAGIVVGMEPRVTDSSINEIDEDSDTSYHIEAFYQFKVNDNIAITPGVVCLTAPEHNENNEDVVIGAFRTTFTF